MAHVEELADVSLSEPILVEGLPGRGLVGKIAVDHLVETFDMDYVAGVHCDGIPNVAVYHGGSSEVLPPVRIHADEERDLLALQSDVPVSPSTAEEFAGCVTGWLGSHDVFPIYVSGLAEEKEAPPAVYGIATGAAGSRLEAAGISPPGGGGVVSGPTGALVNAASEAEFDAVGLIAQSDPQFPDPEAARAVIENGIEPLTGVDADTDALVEHAEEIRKVRERMAKQVQQAEDASSEAHPIRGFQ
ncbi:MAG: PAC2 family protein [Haloarculaceae archaeon]